MGNEHSTEQETLFPFPSRQYLQSNKQKSTPKHDDPQTKVVCSECYEFLEPSPTEEYPQIAIKTIDTIAKHYLVHHPYGCKEIKHSIPQMWYPIHKRSGKVDRTVKTANYRVRAKKSSTHCTVHTVVHRTLPLRTVHKHRTRSRKGYFNLLVSTDCILL